MFSLKRESEILIPQPKYIYFLRRMKRSKLRNTVRSRVHQPLFIIGLLIQFYKAMIKNLDEASSAKKKSNRKRETRSEGK